MPGLQFGRFTPSEGVPEGRMLRASGALTATITSRVTGRHLTIRLRCSRRDESGPSRWPTVAFDEATHLFVDDFDGQELATYAPSRGAIAWGSRTTPAAEWAIVALMRYLGGMDTKLTTQAELAVVSHCRRCGRELTDPESIERGYGPDCWGEATGSRPVAASGQAF